MSVIRGETTMKKDKYRDTYRILAKGILQSNNTRETGLNNNDLIIGPSGSGKTRGYVIPNILQANESMIIADTKGNLADTFTPYLKKKGYKVKVLDFKKTLNSCGFNPLDNIRYNSATGRYSEQDILKLAACIAPDMNEKEPFWDQQGRSLLVVLIAYVLEKMSPKERNLVSVLRMFSEWTKESAGKMFARLEHSDPDSFALARYKMIKRNSDAEKMSAGIEAFTEEALDIFAFDGTKRMVTNPDKVDIKAIGRKKTAVFLNISDTDRSMDKLVNVFYTQALQMLCDEAESHPGCRLPVPVRFIMDDFATNTKVPDFDNLISVIRSRQISVSLVVQSITQLDGLYGSDRARTIVNNCDTCLYLGGQDIKTAEIMSVKADVPVNAILDMSTKDAYLFVRGESARKVKKYTPADHPEYVNVMEALGDDELPEPEEEPEEELTLGFSM